MFLKYFDFCHPKNPVPDFLHLPVPSYSNLRCGKQTRTSTLIR